jgi:hypothetical protein
MRQQHTIGGQQKGDQEQEQGILVPLDLPEFKIMGQSQQADGSLEVHVIAIKDCDTCLTCRSVSGKLHATRNSIKRDSRLRSYQVRLVLYKRRFRCPTCRRAFTENETMRGRYKRTTKHLPHSYPIRTLPTPHRRFDEDAEQDHAIDATDAALQASGTTAKR